MVALIVQGEEQRGGAYNIANGGLVNSDMFKGIRSDIIVQSQVEAFHSRQCRSV